jgi:uncharacterized protein
VTRDPLLFSLKWFLEFIQRRLLGERRAIASGLNELRMDALRDVVEFVSLHSDFKPSKLKRLRRPQQHPKVSALGRTRTIGAADRFDWTKRMDDTEPSVARASQSAPADREGLVPPSLLNPATAGLNVLYDEVDAESHRLEDVHGARLKCRRGCSQCCVDDLTVFEVEATRIRTKHAELLATQQPHPLGMCAFLDAEGACRIYNDRPYVCRTQGLPLRWLEERDDWEFVELRDICPLNDEGTPIEELFEDECWTIGPIEERLAALQSSSADGRMDRVSLRSLFVGPH